MSTLRQRTRLSVVVAAISILLGSAAARAVEAQGAAASPAKPADNLSRAAEKAVFEMRRVRDEANRQFLALNPDFATLPPADIQRWLAGHPAEKQRFEAQQADAQARRQAIYDRFTAERARLQQVNAAGGQGKVGYVFVGDLEYNPDKKLDVFNATLRNMITLGFLTGNEPSRLEDHEALIRQREEMLRQKFETVQVVYLAHEKDLGQALSSPDTGGYVFVSHGASDEPAVMDDAGQLITRDEVRALMQGARDRYVAKVLPPAIAKLYQASRSADPAAASQARRALAAMGADDKALYKYVLAESAKVHLDLSYVEHYSCYSGNEGAQDYADLLLGDGGVYVGYAGPTDSTGKAGKITFAGRTVPATRFRAKAGRATPDPDPVGTMRKKKPGAEDAAVLAALQRTTKAVFALYGCRGGKQTELHYTKKTVDTSKCEGQAGNVYTATVYPISWSGSSFSGTFTLPSATGPNAQAGTITVSGSVDTVARRVTAITSASTHTGEGWTLTESVNTADVPLQTEQYGYFTFVADKEAFPGKLTGYSRLYLRKGEDPALGPREAKERGVEPGVRYPASRQEDAGLGDFVMEAPGSMIRLSLTPTDMQGNRVNK